MQRIPQAHPVYGFLHCAASHVMEQGKTYCSAALPKARYLIQTRRVTVLSDPLPACGSAIAMLHANNSASSSRKPNGVTPEPSKLRIQAVREAHNLIRSCHVSHYSAGATRSVGVGLLCVPGGWWLGSHPSHNRGNCDHLAFSQGSKHPPRVTPNAQWPFVAEHIRPRIRESGNHPRDCRTL
jgi:hypothetical protein